MLYPTAQVLEQLRDDALEALAGVCEQRLASPRRRHPPDEYVADRDASLLVAVLAELDRRNAQLALPI